MKFDKVVSILLLGFLVSSPVMSQEVNDYFWSFQNLGEGAVNEDLNGTFGVGETVSVYLYNSPFGPDEVYDSGFVWDIEIEGQGILELFDVESYEYEVLSAKGLHEGFRWTSNGVSGNSGIFG